MSPSRFSAGITIGRAGRRDEQRKRRVDQLRLVRHLRVPGCRRVHLLLQHSLVDRAHRVLRAAEHLRARSLGLTERELGHGAADASLDPLGAKRDLGVALSLAPLLGAVGVADCHANDGDRSVDTAERHHARDPAARANDHLAADLLAEDAVRRADVVLSLRGDGGRFQAQPVLADRARRLEHDVVPGLAALCQRQIEARQRELDADDVGAQDTQRLLEQLLPGLVTLENDDCASGHRRGF